MATVFDEFRQEFDKMPRDEQVQLGMAGLIQMYSGGSGGSKMSRQLPSRGSSNDEGMSISGIGDTVRVHVESMDERTMDTFVSKMRKQTYSVRIASVFNDLIDPLAHRMNTNMIKNQIFMNRIQYENVLYYRGIIEAVNNLGGSNKENFFEAVTRQYHNFMRHPIWNTMRVISSTVLKPMANLASGILFGFKKRKSDTDRIVQAIEEQTEFMRTGRIERESNALMRLVRGGLVNELGRSLTGMVTGGRLSIEGSRQAKEQMAQGQQADLWGKMSNFFFGKHTDVRGQEWKEQKQLDYQNSNLDYQNRQLEVLNAIAASTNRGANAIMTLEHSMSTSYQDTGGATGTYGGGPLPFSGGGAGSNTVNEISKFYQRDAANHELNLENSANIADMRDYSKETSKDIDKIRRMQASERIMNWLRSGVSATSRVISSIGSTIGGAVAGGLAGGLAGGAALPVILTGLGLYAARKLTDIINSFTGTTREDEALEREARLNPSAGIARANRRIEAINNTPEVKAILARIEELETERDSLPAHVGPGNPRVGYDNRIRRLRDELRQERSVQRQNMAAAESDESLIAFLQQKEGFRANAYRDVKQWSIGYGSGTVNGAAVQPGQSITRSQALEALRADASRRKQELREGIDATLTANQLNALTSLAYNVGTGAVLDSTLVRKLEAGDVEGAANEFARWNKVDGQAHLGLTQRRAEEKAMFLGNFRPAASPAGSRLTDGAVTGAINVATGASTKDWGEVVAGKLDQVVSGLRELINGQEGTGSNADANSVFNIMGR